MREKVFKVENNDMKSVEKDAQNTLVKPKIPVTDNEKKNTNRPYLKYNRKMDM